MPDSYVIYPAKLRDEFNNNQMPFKKNYRDEREAFRAAHKLLQSNGRGEVWIAKSTAGAKGKNLDSKMKHHLWSI